NSELRILSVVARQSSKNAKILKILEQLGLRYNFAQGSDIETNLSDEGRFDDFLRRAESDIKTDAMGNWSRRLIPTTKYLVLPLVTLIAFYALIVLLN
ncbi:MAG: hypothetical protein VXY78_05345, partial [Pseudomonadota bacterium]|nr:hypothetical protein [Pseudomonadota bacterium]